MTLARPGSSGCGSARPVISCRSRDQAGRWHAVPGLSPPRRAAVREHETASGELGRLKAGVLAAAGQLRPVTMESLLAGSGWWLGGVA